MCYLCHPTERHDPDVYGEDAVPLEDSSWSKKGTYPPMFTDFSYDNLGIPVNPRIAVLAGDQSTDLGLGDSSRMEELEYLYESASEFDEWGKFRVSTLRNIAKTAPYGHNGFFPTLYSIVHFYNTRDVEGGDFHGVVNPEVVANVNVDELGNLGLTFDQEMKIVMFLESLTDK